jgi:hypothetical protein
VKQNTVSFDAKSNTSTNTSLPTRGIKPMSRFCEENYITRATGWRWRRNGWINTINIYGRQYVTRDEEERFLRRAAQGEFHRDPHAPVAAKEIEVDV